MKSKIIMITNRSDSFFNHPVPLDLQSIKRAMECLFEKSLINEADKRLKLEREKDKKEKHG